MLFMNFSKLRTLARTLFFFTAGLCDFWAANTALAAFLEMFIACTFCVLVQINGQS